jgi:hypothetical protein
MATGQQPLTAHKLSAEQANLVRSALESVIASEAFAPSKRCQDFLRLIVEHALAGDLDALRERMIGVEMFGRRVDYDTSNDAVVRVRATEVRKRLAQYYREAAPAPIVRIELPPGSYVPEFHWSSPKRVNGGGVAVHLAPAPRWTRASLFVTTALLVGAALVFVIWLASRTKTRPAGAVQLSLGLPEGVTLHRNWHPFEHIALSPRWSEVGLRRHGCFWAKFLVGQSLELIRGATD